MEVADGEGEHRFAARPIGPARFEIVGGRFDGDRFDFPLDGFARFGSRLAPRIA